MGFRIVVDSCTDVPKEFKEKDWIRIVPLSIQIDEHTVVDDETFNQADFLAKIKASPNCPKSSCPSPESYMDAYQGDDDIYVVTLSSKLSASYNSAILAKKLYSEENTPKNISVFDSKSASVGQTLLMLKIKELAEKGETFEEITKKVTEFRDAMDIKFVLESLETLRKNGRLSNLKAIICSALNIKPVMGATPDGEICKIDQARGMNRALTRMAEIIQKEVVKPEQKILAIAHCNNLKRAEAVKQEIMGAVHFKECFIVDTAGISSLYANDGGIIVSY